MSLTSDRSKQKLTLAQFVEQLPDEEGRYELVDGEIVRIYEQKIYRNSDRIISQTFPDLTLSPKAIFNS
jgi:Uma2 family endonuclease